MWQAGDRLGRFRLVREVGQGSYGVVFQATDTVLDTPVAVKILHPWLTEDSAVRDRFKRELLLARRVTHPGVCRLFDLHEEGEAFFITMDYVEGQTLLNVLKNEGRLRPLRGTRIMRGVCQALAAAHSAGVIHRDLKPANIILRADDHPMILDFGTATAGDVSRVTRPGTAVGSMRFIAPEVFTGVAPSARTDLYTLGVVAYVTFAGKLPYNAASGALEMLEMIRYQPAKRLDALHPDVPAHLADVVARAMEKNPDLRFASAMALDEALAEVERALEASGARAVGTGDFATWPGTSTSTPVGSGERFAPQASGITLGNGVSRAPVPSEPDVQSFASDGADMMTEERPAEFEFVGTLESVADALAPPGSQDASTTDPDGAAPLPPHAAATRPDGEPWDHDPLPRDAPASHRATVQDSRFAVADLDRAQMPAPAFDKRVVVGTTAILTAGVFTLVVALVGDGTEGEGAYGNTVTTASAYVVASPSASPDPVGTNPVGTNPVGTNPVGTNPVGTNPVGTNPVGTNPVGTNPVGTKDSETDPDGGLRPIGQIVAPKMPKAPDASRFDDAMEQARAAMERKGFIAGDLPAVDALLERAQSGRDAKIAREALAAVKRQRIDRDFLLAKLARYNASYDQSKQPEITKRTDPLAREVASHLSGGRFQQANDALNRAMRILGRPQQQQQQQRRRRRSRWPRWPLLSLG